MILVIMACVISTEAVGIVVATQDTTEHIVNVSIIV